LSLLDSLRHETVPSLGRRHWPQIYFGVVSTSLATLLLELALTRVFSVVYFYHFAFLAISIALFGLGAGGVFSYVVAGWPGSLYRKLGVLATVNAIAIVFCLSFLLDGTGNMKTAELLGAYFIAAIPFLLSGAILSLAIGGRLRSPGSNTQLGGRSKHDSRRRSPFRRLIRDLVSSRAWATRPRCCGASGLGSCRSHHLQREILPYRCEVRQGSAAP
jgi:hypothetical protein